MITYPSIQINLGGGQFVSFSRRQIITAEIVEEVNIVGTDMPFCTLEFTVDNSDNSFSMFDGAIYEKLKERLPISVYENVGSASVFMGLYYLATWKNTTDRQAEFTATDIIGVMAETDFDGIFWDEPVTLTKAMADVFSPAGVAYEIQPEIAGRTVSGWIPPGTYRDALQQICFAARVSALTARTDKLVIHAARLPLAYRDYVITSSEARQTNIEALPIVARIEVVSHNYSPSEETETIFDKTLPAGSHKIVFDKPYYDIIIDGAGYVQAGLATEGGEFIGTEGGDYIEAGGEFTFGSNSVFIDIEEESHITITGKKWLDSKRSYVFNEPNTESVRNKRNYLISNATLVSADRAQDVLDNLRDYYRLRYLQDITILPSDIKVSEIVLTDTINARRVIGSVQKAEISLTGGFLTKNKIVGILPSYVPPIENPTRYARTGLAVCGADLTYNNRWRQYA